MTDLEQQLLERIRQGETSSLAEYVDFKRPQLLGFIMRNLSDAMKRKVDPEDILQEVCISCVNSLPEVDLSERDPFSWICHNIERRIIDAHRHHFDAQKRAADREVALDARMTASRQTPLGDLLVASMTSPSQAFSRDQREFRVLQAIEDLPEEAQEALRLRFMHGMATKQIAEELGKSDAAIRVLLSRTLKRLELKLEASE